MACSTDAGDAAGPDDYLPLPWLCHTLRTDREDDPALWPWHTLSRVARESPSRGMN